MLDIPNSGQESAPRGDRRWARREATRAEILDAAWALAREQGFAGLSLRDLAARVGMRAPSLYQYFDSKHAIYDAMFRQAAEEGLAALAAIPVESDPLVRLRRGAHVFFAFAVDDPARAQLLFQRTIPGFEPSPESYAPAVATVEVLRAQLQMCGINGTDAVDVWTAMIGGLVAQQLANDPGGHRWARLVDQCLDMYLAQFLSSNIKEGEL